MARIGIRVFDLAVPAGSSFEYGIGAMHRVCFGDETTLQISCSICPAILWSSTLRPFWQFQGRVGFTQGGGLLRQVTRSGRSIFPEGRAGRAHQGRGRLDVATRPTSRATLRWGGVGLQYTSYCTVFVRQPVPPA